MFGSVGFPELMVILIIALIVFGPRRLPEIGKALGQTLNEFKKGAASLRDSMESEIQRETAQEKRAIPPATTQVQSVPGTEPRNG
jgi:sec-independent protein translocase protein TatA